MRNVVLSGPQLLYGAGLGAWGLTLLLSALELYRGAAWPHYEVMLIGLAALALPAGSLWLKGMRFWRPAFGALALAYLVVHAARIYVYEVRPLLGVVDWPNAVGGALYVVWSWGRHELSRGSFALGLSYLFREWFMPIIQLGVLAAALQPRRLPSPKEDRN